MEVSLEQKQRVRQKLSQQQRLNRVLRDSLKLLMAPSVELKMEMENHLLENPVIELEEEKTEDDERDLIDYLVNQSALCRGSGAKRGNIDNVPSPAKSIYEELDDQVNLICNDKRLGRQASLIVGNLDRNGYLTISLEDLALLSRSTTRQLEKALKFVQSLDPPGIAARNVKECLSIQATRKGDGRLASIIERYLIDFSEGNFGLIAGELNISEDEVKEILIKIRMLNPRPGLKFGADLPSEISYLEPDIYIKEEKGYLFPQVNSRVVPRARISKDYRRLLDKAKRDGNNELEKYLSEKMESASQLFRSFEKREQTLERIGYALIDLQGEFFKSGGLKLKPMKMEEVSGYVGCHVSTISRACHLKIVSTPFGNFPLSYFFSSPVGPEVLKVSSRIVKREIRRIVSEERGSSISDERVRQILERKGFVLSRRTVTKYRKSLGIAPLHIRNRIGDWVSG